MDRGERVMIFIDGSNLYHSLKTGYGRTDIDIGKFCEKLLEKRRLIRIYYYNAIVGETQEPERYRSQQTFLNSVRMVPYLEMRLGRLVYTNAWPSSPPYEKGIDIMLATDLLTHSFKQNYDVAIVVGGDTDYVGAIQQVKNNGQNVEVALFGHTGSVELRHVADRTVEIDGRYLKGCWKQGGGIPLPTVVRQRGQPRQQPVRQMEPAMEMPQAMPQPMAMPQQGGMSQGGMAPQAGGLQPQPMGSGLPRSRRPSRRRRRGSGSGIGSPPPSEPATPPPPELPYLSG